ncbi:MAG: AAA family ATPase [Pseudomonadota bacterium]
MKIASVRVENFRGFKDETIHFDDYTCFVGPNGSGKSTVLAALNIFFRQYKDSRTDLSKLTVDDFHHKNVSVPIRITVTFVDLSATATEDLSNYVREGKLIVSAIATYDPRSERAEVKQTGWRMGIPEFAPWFKDAEDGKKTPELLAVYEGIRKNHADFGLKESKNKPKMEEELRACEAKHPERHAPLQSEDQFYGARGTNKLSAHLQWIFVPAVKDAAEEADENKNSSLGQLLGRTIRSKVDFTQRVAELRATLSGEYQKILDSEQGVLETLSLSLQLKLRDWAHPGATARVLWKNDPDKSVQVELPLAFMQIGERGYTGELFRFGHGMQRSCMLTLLHELATVDGVESLPTLIMGIEEPELYQHPPQARYLGEVLHDLSRKGSQILLCSHSPLFIPGDDVEAIRVVRERSSPPESCVSSLKYSELASRLEECGDKLYRAPGILAKLFTTLNPTINEMFFCKALVLVESLEDVAYLTAYLELEKRMADFRRGGCHIVPVGRKSDLLKPLLVAKSFSIPLYVVFDADTNSKEKYHDGHKTDNKRLLIALGHPEESEWPERDLWLAGCTVWSSCIGNVARQELGANWGVSYTKACASYGDAGDLDKNPLVLAETLEDAFSHGHKSASMSRLANVVADFAKAASVKSTDR